MDNHFCYGECFLCDRPYRAGPSIYDGRKIPAYDISVCMLCYRSNWDGFTYNDAAKIETHLKIKGLHIPQRNEKGWLPRDGEFRLVEIADK